MARFLKKHLGVIIFLIIMLVFPTSLSNQARLNMKIIVTGLAIDKVDGDYEITAQIVKPAPGSESAGTSASVNFVSDSDKSIIGAVSKLSHKEGKVASFSHTNFIIIGKDVLEDNLTELLDYFMRNQIIKSSSLLLFAEDKASDEIQKTKDVELSVAIGLQKVFLFKEKESDGKMTTILEFLNKSKDYSKTATASSLALASNEETSKLAKQKSGSDSQSSGTESGSGGSSSSGSGSGGDSSKPTNQYFKSKAPIYCFVDGNFAGKLENPDEVSGLLLSDSKTVSDDVSIEDFSFGKFKNAKIGVHINKKIATKNIRYENDTPCLDITIKVLNSKIEEIRNETLVSDISAEEFDAIKLEIEKFASEKIVKCFNTSKSFNADVFESYDLAMRYQFKKTNDLYNNVSDFLNDLKINVQVDVLRMEY